MTKAPPRLVGVIHLPPLPGSPRASASVAEIAAAAADDARVLEGAGFDLVMIENFGDAPFVRSAVSPVTVAAMTACAGEVRRAVTSLALGINVLRNDAEAALGIAVAVSASCVRVNVHTGARVTDQGIVQGEAADTLRTRRALSADHVAIWADVDVKHSAPLAARPIEEETEDLVLRGLADAVLVTGHGTGAAIDAGDLARVAKAARGAPVYVASGAREADLGALAEHATGVIVGSALRADGRAGGRVDRDAAERFARAFRAVFPSK